MARDLQHFEKELVSASLRDIQSLVAEDYITDALEKLFDFIRDFNGEGGAGRDLLREAMKLSARHARLMKARRHKLSLPEQPGDIIDELLSIAERASDAAQMPQPDDSADVDEIVADIHEAPHAQHDAQALRALYLQAMQRRKPADEQVVAELRNVVRRYGKTGFELGPVSLTLRPGEITGVVGMNASGKTTMLRCLLGELKPNSGEVAYPAIDRENNSTDWRARKSRMSYVAQLPERWPGRLRNNLNFTAACYGMTGAENEERVEWYLHRYGLKAYENAGWDEISGGFKIRFELVRALLMRPRLLVLDEPLAYLDIITQQIFLHDLKSIASAMRRPIPILVTSQHLHEIEAIADRMVILDSGKTVYSGLLSELPTLQSFRMYEVEISAPKSDILERLRPVGLHDIEKTSTGWILIFKREVDESVIHQRLLEAFPGKMRAYRDISRSTRCLFRNHRDDFESYAHIEGASSTGPQA